MISFTLYYIGANAQVASETSISNSVEAMAGVAQTITMDGLLSNYDYVSVTASHKHELFGLPVQMGGRFQMINGQVIWTGTGISIQYDKSKVLKKQGPKLINPIDLKRKQDSLLALGKVTLPDSLSDKFKLDTALQIPKVDLGKLDDINLGALDSLKAIKEIELSDFPKAPLPKESVDLDPEFDLNSRVNGGIKSQEKQLRLNDFGLGLGVLSATELIGQGISYQGAMLGVQKNQNTVQLATGVTNRLPSLNSLLRNPIALKGVNPNENLLSSFSNLASLTNSLLYNKDIINWTNSNYFAGVMYQMNWVDGIKLKLSHFYVHSLSDNPLITGYSNLSSAELSKSHRLYNIELEVSNCQRNNQIANSTSNDLPSQSYLSDASLSPAFRCELKGNLSQKSSVRLKYRNLSRGYYSPLSLVNNNLVDNLQLGYEINLKWFSSESYVSNGRLRTNNRDLPTRTLGENLGIRFSEVLKGQISASYSSFTDSLSQAHSVNLTFNLVLKSRVVAERYLQLGITYFDYSQLLISDTLVRDLKRGFFSCVSPLSSKILSQFNADYANIQQKQVYTLKEDVIFKLTKFQITTGAHYLNFANSYWGNIAVGFSFLSNSNFSASLTAERTVVTNSNKLFNGQIQMSYAF